MGLLEQAEKDEDQGKSCTWCLTRRLGMHALLTVPMCSGCSGNGRMCIWVGARIIGTAECSPVDFGREQERATRLQDLDAHGTVTFSVRTHWMMRGTMEVVDMRRCITGKGRSAGNKAHRYMWLLGRHEGIVGGWWVEGGGHDGAHGQAANHSGSSTLMPATHRPLPFYLGITIHRTQYTKCQSNTIRHHLYRSEEVPFDVDFGLRMKYRLDMYTAPKVHGTHSA